MTLCSGMEGGDVSKPLISWEACDLNESVESSNIKTIFREQGSDVVLKLLYLFGHIAL